MVPGDATSWVTPADKADADLPRKVVVVCLHGFGSYVRAGQDKIYGWLGQAGWEQEPATELCGY